jgi:predicted esterase
MIIHLPINFNPERKYKLLLFFHGLGDHPWSVAINETNWRKLSNEYQFIIAYAAGTSCNLVWDRRCGFDIKYPNDDLHYMEKMIRTATTTYNIEENGIFYIGFSNGAILSSIVAQKYGGGVFNAMVNIMGGFGHQFILDLDLHVINPVPILFITGTHDDYKSSCEYAFYFFKNRGYDVKMKTLDNISHIYPISEEEHILSFLGIKPIE